ncbi:MAG: homoserine kinase [Candidatus Dormibacteraeota bacterium]|uniref:Homoserine kinase n=1 Tax=Candidatus Amunia macphersoniae TaxID=3127014 RepID=A0A934KG43_9BACT|nr:homoserine kinase [Candidatus Dormibacteraeota bacterium]
MKATVRVPATVANLGPGFDLVALALQLQNEVHAQGTGDGVVAVVVDGGGADAELLDPLRNLVARAYVQACTQLGVPDDERGVTLRCVNAIPMSRGLGSSAAAALSGVLVAVALQRASWQESDILGCVSGFEGHSDNAAAALLGGLAICAPGAAPQRCDVPDELHAVLFAPQRRLATHEARQVVATSFSRADALFNAGRCALLVRALLLKDYSALREAMDDRWHQAQRASLFPAMGALIDAAYAAGADGACLAGAGPSILALTARDPAPLTAALSAAAARLSVEGSVLVLRPRNFGSRVEVRP